MLEHALEHDHDDGDAQPIDWSLRARLRFALGAVLARRPYGAVVAARGVPLAREPACAYRLVAGAAAQHDGWSCGRPPGITPAQWPRSRENGVPLRHAFTLRLPPGYLVRDEGVAVAFLHAPESKGSLEPTDAQHVAQRHPRERYFECVGEFVLRWLDARGFAGAPCALPDLADPWECESDAPMAAQDLDAFRHDDAPRAWLRLEPYADPDAGLAPGGYTPLFSERGEALALPALRVGTHFGGTSFAVQGVPDGRSAFYLEVEHDFGGINLGGDGHGQLDLRNES